MSLKSAIEKLIFAVKPPPTSMQGRRMPCPPPISCYTRDESGWYHHTAQYIKTENGECKTINESIVKIKGHPCAGFVECPYKPK